uniref:Uncharacterized protein n=1 Tax=Cucumis sativus TaxID=3659 RepID=A0A0A0LRI7_CUCSA
MGKRAEGMKTCEGYSKVGPVLADGHFATHTLSHSLTDTPIYSSFSLFAFRLNGNFLQRFSSSSSSLLAYTLLLHGWTRPQLQILLFQTDPESFEAKNDDYD